MSEILPYQIASETLSLKEKIGQFFIPAAFINDSEEEIQKLERLIKEHAIGGICFFHSRASAATNYEGKKEVIYNAESLTVLKQLITRFQKAAKFPLLIAIDAEWGLAMRVENTPQFPYAITLGAIQAKEDLIFEVGKQIALDCKDAGIHWNFAPAVDINNNPENPVIGYRSFGENKEQVSKKSIAFANGMRSVGILNSAKHFPGHGDTATDSHLGLPLIEKTKEDLLKNELYPFKKLIENDVDSVMVGHLSVPALTGDGQLPTSISQKTLKEVLRHELGFEGIVVSDALNMHAVSKRYPVKGWLEWLAFDAGNDVLCFAEHPYEGIRLIEGHATSEVIEASFKRVWKLKERAFLNAKNATQDKRDISPEQLNLKLAKASLSFYKGDTNAIEKFRTAGFTAIALSKQGGSVFFDGIKNVLSFDELYTATTAIKEIEASVEKEQRLLLALVPPKVKPQNNFDIPQTELEFINQVAKQKQVILYLFGNPYVLNKIDVQNLAGIVIVYQDFKVFQDNAAMHFLGKVSAEGKVPVTIKKQK